MITREKVLEALSQVDDPDLRKDIVSLNMVKNLELGDGFVSFDVELTTPACPMKDAIQKACINAVHLLVDKNVEVRANMTSRVTSKRTDTDKLKGVRNIIAVASGKGGVGKSTISLNLALALSETGASVGLLDADIHGPSIPLMTGIRKLDQSEGEGLRPMLSGRLKVMSLGFFVDATQPVVWRGPMVASALKQMLLDADWGDLDYLIIDLPPGTGDTHLSLVQHVPLSGVVMVTTPQKMALEDCRKAIGMFQMPQINVPVLGIVENMSWFTPTELPEHKYPIFGSGGGQHLSEEYQIKLLAQIPMVMGIMEQAESGHANHERMDQQTWEYFEQLAGEVARAMAIHNAHAS